MGAMTTDNRTDEPTEAMLDAAGEAYDDHWEGGVWGDEFGERTCQFCGHLYQTAEERKNQANSGSDLMRARSRHSLRAALVAAAGAAPVQPSSTVDEATLIREAKAEAWDEGAYDHAELVGTWHLDRITNPYREGSET